jgi:hypothetical protein
MFTYGKVNNSNILKNKNFSLSCSQWLAKLPPRYSSTPPPPHRKIRLKEKQSSKKIDLERDFAAGVYLSEAQNPITPHPHTVHIRVYCTLIHTGKRGRGGELNHREVERGNSSQSWVENNV